ncbi:MAG: serine hydrolase [Pseudomonadota bacterium]
MPADAGMDADLLADAVAFAGASESAMNRDIRAALEDAHFGEPPEDGAVIGPTRERGDPSGMILRGGKIVAEWGPVDRADMTFSITKSYIALVAGIAVADGLIPDLDAPARELVPDLFEAEQNRAVTWRHLLTNASEWEGTLWGKADRIDRHRILGTPSPGAPPKGSHRDLAAPGGFWEYNDVRVNVCAYALMRVLRRPLPEVLRERIMDPIGASPDWEWHGYESSWVQIDGRDMQSVSGGGHWGGGMMISTRDHARAGLLVASNGRWGDRQILPEGWIDQCLSPCALNPQYGFLWWLNGTQEQAPSAPRSSVFAIGVGRNAIWLDRDLDLVAVVRWIEGSAFDGFCARVMDAIRT